MPGQAEQSGRGDLVELALPVEIPAGAEVTTPAADHDHPGLGVRRWPAAASGTGPPSRPRWSRVHRVGSIERDSSDDAVAFVDDVGIGHGVSLDRSGCLFSGRQLRQEHVPALHQPARARRRRRDLGRRRAVRVPAEGRRAGRAVGPRDRAAAARQRHGVPALQPVRPPHGAAEHHRRTGDRAAATARRGDRRGGSRSSSASVSPPSATPTRRISPAASSSGSPSRARWR